MFTWYTFHVPSTYPFFRFASPHGSPTIEATKMAGCDTAVRSSSWRLFLFAQESPWNLQVFCQNPYQKQKAYPVFTPRNEKLEDFFKIPFGEVSHFSEATLLLNYFGAAYTLARIIVQR